jgi:hypothetical protein
MSLYDNTRISACAVRLSNLEIDQSQLFFIYSGRLIFVVLLEVYPKEFSIAVQTNHSSVLFGRKQYSWLVDGLIFQLHSASLP